MQYFQNPWSKKEKKQLFFKEATTYPDMTLITTRRYDII